MVFASKKSGWALVFFCGTGSVSIDIYQTGKVLSLPNRHGHSDRRVRFGSGSFGSGSFGCKSLRSDRVISNSRFRVGSDRAGSGSGRVLDS